MITQNDIHQYTEGDCHILAMAISRITGWPVCAFASNNEQPDIHAFVKTPNGKYLDVKGIHTHDELWAKWYPIWYGLVWYDITHVVEVPDHSRFALDGWGSIYQNAQDRARVNRRAKKVAAELVESLVY